MFKKQRYYIVKWYKMLTGKSVSHAPQSIGLMFEKDEINGYFNDLTNKVLMQPTYLRLGELPVVQDSNGKEVIFPVAVFQYGLGAYDLYLRDKDVVYKDKFFECVQWAIETQKENGAWDNFSMFNSGIPPFGAMCQGEGASLLLRAYKNTQNVLYLERAQKAIDFMLKSVSNGGTTLYNNDQIILLECTNASAILNGWIFALFGLYDFTLVSNDIKYKVVLEKSLKTLSTMIQQYNCGYWSYYDLSKNLASPFYHDLHIAQLTAICMIFPTEELERQLLTFKKFKKNKLFCLIAFIRKTFQKIF